MSACQNEPLFDVATNLSAILLGQFPTLKHGVIGWPDRKWIQLDGNLPCIVFTDISERGEHVRPVGEVSSQGAGSIKRELLRLRTMLQISLFTTGKAQRDSLGFAVKHHLVQNYRVPIIDYALATPAPTGEHFLLHFRHDHRGIQGEPNLWQRDLTFEAVTRLLDAEPAYPVGSLQITQTVSPSPLVPGPAAPAVPPLTISSAVEGIDANGHPVDTIILSLST